MHTSIASGSREAGLPAGAEVPSTGHNGAYSTVAVPGRAGGGVGAGESLETGSTAVAEVLPARDGTATSVATISRRTGLWHVTAGTLGRGVEAGIRVEVEPSSGTIIYEFESKLSEKRRPVKPHLVVGVDAVTDGHSTLHRALPSVVTISRGTGLWNLASVASVAFKTAAVRPPVGSRVAAAAVLAEPGDADVQGALGSPELELAVADGSSALDATGPSALTVVRGTDGSVALVAGVAGGRAVAVGLAVGQGVTDAAVLAVVRRADARTAAITGETGP